MKRGAVECMISVQGVMDEIAALAACSLLIGSVSYCHWLRQMSWSEYPVSV